MFLLILSLVSFYTLFSAAVILVRLRSLTSQRHFEEASSLQHSLAMLQARSTNVRQLVGATFYLFGLVFFLALPLATNILGDSKIPMGFLVLNNFVMYFAFAANVFFVFIVLHSVQWLASGRIHAYAVRFNAKNIA
jgi:hypothetical protein